MSNTATSLKTMHTLSLLAMEEASRDRVRTADIEHLFLALVVSEQPAGQVLRRQGISIDAARAAVAAQHAEQLAAVGIASPPAGDGTIVFHETRGYEWSGRALELMKGASRGWRTLDASAVLRAVVHEDSGFIGAVLHRLGTDADAVCAELDSVDAAGNAARTPVAGALMASHEAFIPAPPEKVWAVLADPTRLPDWLMGVASVETDAAVARAGDTWHARAQTEGADGTRYRVNPTIMRQEVEVHGVDTGRMIDLRIHYPDHPKSNTRLLRVELELAAGGTQARITAGWQRTRPRRWWHAGGIVLRPITRGLAWMQASQIGAALSRLFR